MIPGIVAGMRVAAAAEPASVTWNPADKGSGIVLSNGNLTAVRAGGSAYESVRASVELSGKRYWEVAATWDGAGEVGALGIATAALPMSSTTQYLGKNAADCGVWGPATRVYRTDAVIFTGTAAASANFKFAFDAASRGLWIGFANDAGWFGGGNPATGAAPTAVMPAGVYFPAFTDSRASSVTTNFGAAPFEGAVPAGFSAL